jgi:PIN domain nuclease of toxin-antitoxin system
VALLLDTHVLIWAPTGDPRLSGPARAAITNPREELFVSAVTAFELASLQQRRRIAIEEDFGSVVDVLGLTLLDFPARAWRLVERLPDLHRDPVDRMMIAHAIVGGLTLVTADKVVRSYPVKTLW